VDNDRFLDDPVRMYLAEVGKVPPMTGAEEVRCMQLVRSRGAEAEDAEKRLIEANLHLVVAIAERYQGGAIHILDLIQKGNEGLMKAVESLPECEQESFTEFAALHVERAINEVIASGQPIRSIPVHRRPK
jgi:RNA polymerase primary sigma factor